MAGDQVDTRDHPLRPRDENAPSVAVKRSALVGALVGVLALDWLALDDITTGTDPSLFLETALVLASIPVVTIIIKHLSDRTDRF